MVPADAALACLLLGTHRHGERKKCSTSHVGWLINFSVNESRVPTDDQAPTKAATAARTRDFGRRSSQGVPASYHRSTPSFSRMYKWRPRLGHKYDAQQPDQLGSLDGAAAVRARPRHKTATLARQPDLDGRSDGCRTHVFGNEVPHPAVPTMERERGSVVESDIDDAMNSHSVMDARARKDLRDLETESLERVAHFDGQPTREVATQVGRAVAQHERKQDPFPGKDSEMAKLADDTDKATQNTEADRVKHAASRGLPFKIT